MKKKLLSQLFGGLVLGLLCSTATYAQLSITGQLRTRSELRDGQGTLSAKDADPAFFTSQRTRLNFGYSGHRFKLFTAIQDVRVWGQDASSINRITLDANDGILMHEAWGEFALLDTTSRFDNVSLKVGRQELVYDDARLLGNLDWLQQGRRHDLALLKIENKGWVGHLGAAFNQNQERKTGTTYSGIPAGYAAGTNGIGTMYKSMQFLYAGRKFSKGSASMLFLKDDFNKYRTENSARVLEQGIWSRFTTGAYATVTPVKNLNFTASAYAQRGKDKDGRKLESHLLSAAAMYTATPNFSIGPGVDYTSGNNPTSTDGVNRQFDPLYGTPHKFWGYMDYFYVADGFGRNGLVNYYLKSRYKVLDNLSFTLDAHQFLASNEVRNADAATSLDRNFGTELDLVVNYGLTKVVSIEGGYSTLFASNTLASPAVKNVPNADKQANWAYLMINIKPGFVAK